MTHECSERCVAIINAYNDGLSGPDIGVQYGISTQRVFQLLASHGIRGRRSTNDIETITPEVIQKYKDGMSLKAIANMFSLETGSIKRMLKRNGIVLRAWIPATQRPITLNPPELFLYLKCIAATEGTSISVLVSKVVFGWI